MPESAPEDTSPIFSIKALGVKGGVSKRSERVVVCDLRSVVAAWMAVSGPFGRSEASARVLVVFSVEGEGAREVWKWVRRVWVVRVRDISFCISFGSAMGRRIVILSEEIFFETK